MPNWDKDANVPYYELRPVKPRISEKIKPVLIKLYDALF